MPQTTEDFLKAIYNLIAVGQFEDLIDTCTQTLVAARKDGNRDIEVASMIGLAAAHQHTGKFYDARVLADGALDIARHFNLSERICDALIETAHIKLAGYSRAYEAYDDFREALYLAHDINYERGAAYGLFGVAWAYNQMGSYDRAHRYAREALDAAQELDDTALQTHTLHIIGNAYQGEKEWDKAKQCFDHVREIAATHGFETLTGLACYDTGWVYMQSEDHRPQVMQQFEDAYAIATALNWVRLEFLCLHGMAAWHIADENTEAALELYQEMVNVAEIADNIIYEAATYTHIGKLHHDQSQHAIAIDYFLRTLEISRTSNHPDFEGTSLQWLASAHSAQYEYDEALAYLNQARNVYLALDNQAAARQVAATIVWTTVLSLYDKVLRLFGLRHDASN